MRQAFKWPGFALVAFGVAVFPFAIWFEGPWGVLSLVMVMIGCFLLVLTLRGSGLVVPDEPGEVADQTQDGNANPRDQGSVNGDKPPT